MNEITLTTKGYLELINDPIKEQDKRWVIRGENVEVSDGFHSMSELYDHRMALNSFLFKMMFKLDQQVRPNTCYTYPNVMKSKYHNDDTMFEGYFIVLANTNEGQISYHYKLEHWDKFDLPEVPKIPFEYDGHKSKDVIERLLKL